jgi:hypothetical protein
MCKPQGTVPRVIMILPRSLFHRKISRQSLAISRQDGVTIGPRGPITVNILGEKLTGYFDPHAIRQSGERHS